MTLSTFVSYESKLGRVDLDGYPSWQPFQCYDLAGDYCRRVIGMKGSLPQLLPSNGTAADVYLSFRAPLGKYFKRIPRSSGPPKPGDIVVWSTTLPGSYGAGHTAICLSASSGSFISLDQNWSGPYTRKTSHNYNWVLGYLRPIKTATTASRAFTYTVTRGDTLSAIATGFKVSLKQLIGLNHISNPNLIYQGEKLRIK